MPRRSFNDDLSEEQVIILLERKLQSVRQERLDHYRKTGRLVRLAPDIPSAQFEYFRTLTFPNEERQPLPQSGKFLADGFFLILEFVAILGFAWIVITGLGVLRNLNRKSALASELPPLTPTPMIRPVAIPSGHTPPASPGGTQPNEAEIPRHIRPLIQAYANLPVPTQGPEFGVRIRIPAIGVDAPIIQGDGWGQLKKGVAQRPGSADPGKNGNMVLSGHIEP